MKKLLFSIFFLLCIQGIAQTSLKITPKNYIAKKGVHFKLKEIIEDSRCPEGVNCIWAGQVVVAVEVYEDRKFKGKKILTFNGENNKENKEWFLSHLPKAKTIKTIKIMPTPKEGVEIKFKKRYIELVY